MLADTDINAAQVELPKKIHSKKSISVLRTDLLLFIVCV